MPQRDQHYPQSGTEVNFPPSGTPIVNAKAGENYLEDPATAITPTFGILDSTDGALGIYHGLQTEEAKDAFLFVEWKSLEHHKKLQSDTNVYFKMIEHISNVWASRPRILHANPTEDPSAALRAPITEIALLTLKPGQSMDALVEVVKKLTSAGTPGDRGFISSVYGTVAENDDMLAIIAGWTSVEEHWKAVTTDPQAVALLTEMKQLSDVELAHAPLQKLK